MGVPVMNIRVMRVAVRHGDVRVQVAVIFIATQASFMRVKVVFIMAVLMRMLHHLMQVFVGMVFREVNPHTQSHKSCGNPECHRSRLREENQGHSRANERRG